MSTVLVVTPIFIASWPAVSAAVTAAVATMGFTITGMTPSARVLQPTRNRHAKKSKWRIAKSSRMRLAPMQKSLSNVMEIRATFSRDARGGLRLCMEGKGMSKSQLRELGEELLGRVTQQYAYHRIVTELKERNMTIVDEQMTEEQSVKIRVRNW